MALPDVNPKQEVTATAWRKLLYLLSGKLGDHQQQVTLTGFSNSNAYTLVVRNRGTGGLGFVVQNSLGNDVFHVNDSETLISTLKIAEQSDPATPATGQIVVFGRNDHTLNYKSSDGVVHTVNQAYGQNYLDNAGFEVWSRGNGPFNTTGAWTADRWLLTVGAAATTAVSRTAGVDAGSEFAMAWSQSATGATSTVTQALEKPEKLRGKTITFAMRVKTAYGSAVRLSLTDGTTSANSAYHTGGNSYETLSCSITVSGSATAVTATVQLAIQGQAHTGELDNATLAISSVAIPYEPLSTETEQMRCRRFRQVVEMLETGRAYDATNTVISATRALSPPMSAQTAPTVTQALDVLNLAGSTASFTHTATTASNTSDSYGYHTVKTTWTKAANVENARLAGTVVVEVRA